MEAKYNLHTLSDPQIYTELETVCLVVVYDMYTVYYTYTILYYTIYILYTILNKPKKNNIIGASKKIVIFFMKSID